MEILTVFLQELELSDTKERFGLTEEDEAAQLRDMLLPVFRSCLREQVQKLAHLPSIA